MMRTASRLSSFLRCVALSAAIVLLAHPHHAVAATGPKLSEDTAVAASRAAIGRLIGDHVFSNSLNQKVRLSDFRGRPLVVNMVYSGCADICPTVAATLADAVEVAREALGTKSFSVVTIGFDARRDSPERMRTFARSHGLNTEGWEFLSGDSATVDRLADEIGFLFVAAPQGFDHVSQTTIIDGEGRVYRQIYGATFEPPALVEPLKDLLWGGPAGGNATLGLAERIRLICTIYDAASGRYRFSYAIFIGIGLSGLTLLAIGFVIVRAWLQLKRSEVA